jgi:hypothetical protein
VHEDRAYLFGSGGISVLAARAPRRDLELGGPEVTVRFRDCRIRVWRFHHGRTSVFQRSRSLSEKSFSRLHVVALWGLNRNSLWSKRVNFEYSDRLLGRRPSICLLERGREWPIGNFPDTFEDFLDNVRMGNPLGLYDIIGGRDISVIKGNGLVVASVFTAFWPASPSSAERMDR